MHTSVVFPQGLVALGRFGQRQSSIAHAATPGFRGDEKSAFSSMQATVPDDFRLENRFDHMKEDLVHSWALLDEGQLATRVAATWAWMMAIAYVVTDSVFDPMQQPMQFGLCQSFGATLHTALFVARMFYDWRELSEELAAVKIDYEEGSWMDTRSFAKPDNLYRRDQLLNSSEVAPAVAKCRKMLAALLVMTCVSAPLALGSVLVADNDGGTVGRSRVVAPHRAPDGSLVFGPTVVGALDLRWNDRAAAEEQKSLKGVPGYCYDGVRRAVMGSDICSKFMRG